MIFIIILIGIIITFVIALFVYPVDCNCNSNIFGKCIPHTKKGSYYCNNLLKTKYDNIIASVNELKKSIPNLFQHLPYPKLTTLNSSSFTIPKINSDQDFIPYINFKCVGITNPNSSKLTFNIINKYNNKCLDYVDDNMGKLIDCTGNDYQKWYWDGEQIKNKANNKCLDYVDDYNIKLIDCTNNIYQKWYQDGETLRNVGSDRCLDYRDEDMGYLEECVGNDYQKWEINYNNAF